MAAGDQYLETLKKLVNKTILSDLSAQSGLEGLRLVAPTFSAEARTQINRIASSVNFTTKTGVGSPSAGDIQALKSTSAPVRKHMSLVFEGERLWDEARLAEEVVNQTTRAAFKKMDADLFTAIGSADSTIHPQEGATDTTYAWTPATPNPTHFYIADPDFTMTPLSGGATWTQSNLNNLTFSAANLATVYVQRNKYRQINGEPVEPIKPKLICGNNSYLLANALADQKGRFYVGTPGTADLGFAGMFDGPPIRASSGSSFDDDAWCLWYGEDKVTAEGERISTGPFYIHVREFPEVIIERLPASSDISVYCSFTYDVYPDPIPDQYLIFGKI